MPILLDRGRFRVYNRRMVALVLPTRLPGWHLRAPDHLDEEKDNMPRVALNRLAPNFSLPDFRSNTVSLSDFRDRKNVLLVFNRGFT